MFGQEKDYEPLLPDEELDARLPITDFSKRRSRINTFLAGVLAVSIMANAYMVGHQYLPFVRVEAFASPETTLSAFAKLARDKPVPYSHGAIWSLDTEEATKAWLEVSIDNGIVALDEEFVLKHNLPPAQPFPWDHSKGLYLLNGFHNLHCLKIIHESLHAFHLGKDQPRPFLHTLHCVDSLHQDVICNADDTPRYTTITKDTITGVGQNRMCRDWSKLEEWGRQHHACFSYINETDKEMPNIERFHFCPDNSPYKTVAEDYFEEQHSHQHLAQRAENSRGVGNWLKRGGEHVEDPGDFFKRDGERVEDPGDFFKPDGERVEDPGDFFKRDGEHVEDPGDFFKRDGEHVEDPGNFFKRGNGHIEDPGRVLK